VSPELLADLRRRGVRFTVTGDRLRLSAPRGVLTPFELDDLRAAKPALLTALREENQVRAPEPRAWLLATPYGRIWIASDPEAAAELRAEESDLERLGDPSIPVLEPGDVERLRGKSPEAIGAVLRVYATFPGARVLA
jgi:hypothetical protein